MAPAVSVTAQVAPRPDPVAAPPARPSKPARSSCKYTEADKKMGKEALEGGCSYAEIAELLGRTTQAIEHAVCKRVFDTDITIANPLKVAAGYKAAETKGQKVSDLPRARAAHLAAAAELDRRIGQTGGTPAPDAVEARETHRDPELALN